MSYLWLAPTTQVHHSRQPCSLYHAHWVSNQHNSQDTMVWWTRSVPHGIRSYPSFGRRWWSHHGKSQLNLKLELAKVKAQTRLSRLRTNQSQHHWKLSVSPRRQRAALRLLLQVCPKKGPDPVDAKRSHTKPKSPVRQARTALDSNQGVPVNLTYKLTRKQQTVKFKSVSAGFPNHPYAAYWQDSADTENDNRSNIKRV